MCIRYYQADPYYSNMMYNPPDVRWHMLNHIMSQYYLHYLGIFKLKGLVNPTKTMPDKVPPTCDMRCGTCGTCTANYQWWNQFNEITDDLLWRFNVHQHKIEDKDHNHPGCLNPKGECKAWFPRTLFDRTVVSEVDGRIDLKKH